MKTRQMAWTVTVAGEPVAKFRRFDDAHFYAQARSRSDCCAEVHGRDAIYGQYMRGEPTKEFEGHYYSALDMAADDKRHSDELAHDRYLDSLEGAGERLPVGIA